MERGMTNLDKFGLVSGLIGFVADIISLSQLVNSQSQSLPSGIPNAMPPSMHVKAIVLFSVVYTTIILSFYARRCFCVTQRRRYGEYYKDETVYKHAVEQGSTFVTVLIGAPLVFSYLSFVLNLMPGTDIGLSDTFKYVSVGSLLAALVLNLVAKLIYKAFDPNYDSGFFFRSY